METTISPAPAQPVIPKPVMDVKPPAVPVSQKPAPNHMPVQPAPEGSALPVAPSKPQVMKHAPTNPQASPKTPRSIGIVITTIAVMLALSGLAVVAYLHSKA